MSATLREVKVQLPALVLCAVFVVLCVAADGWDTKRIHGCVGQPMVRVFDAPLTPALDTLIAPGHCAEIDRSYPYRLAVAIGSLVTSKRTTCLRIVSVFFGVVSLWLLHQLGLTLYGGRVALVFTLVLLGSPGLVELLRAYGYISLATAAVAGILLLEARAIRGRMGPGGQIGWSVARTVLCLSTLSLYAVGRLVLALPLLCDLYRARRGCRKTLVPTAMLVLPVVLLFAVWPAARTQLVEAVIVGDEWMAEPATSEKQHEMLASRARNNAVLVLGYLSGTQDLQFSAPGPRSRMVAPVLAPLLLLGVLVCLWRRDPSDLFVVACLVVVVGVPLLSSGLPARRMVYAYIPCGLLIAVGAVFLHSLAASRLRSPIGRGAVAVALALWLLVPSALGMCAFVRDVSRTDFDATGASLAEVARLMEDSSVLASSIALDKTIDEVIYGNPQLMNGPLAREVTRVLLPSELAWSSWRDRARRTGGATVVISAAPGDCPEDVVLPDRISLVGDEVFAVDSVRLESQRGGLRPITLCAHLGSMRAEVAGPEPHSR